MSRIALVTGANQGLGLSVVRLLARELSANDVVYLASRSEARGQAAVQQLRAESADNLNTQTAKIEAVQLDVTDITSIRKLSDFISEQHGGLDLVVSNAAARIHKDEPQSRQVRAFVSTNNHGSKALYEALEPLLNANARYLIVASSFGQLNNLPDNLHPLFDVNNVSLNDIEQSMDRYVEAMENNHAEADGWPQWINIPSKIGQVATAKVAARLQRQQRPEDHILVNAVCPGLMDTAASRPWFDSMDQALSTDEAARYLLPLLLSSDTAHFPDGQLIQYGRVLPWL